MGSAGDLLWDRQDAFGSEKDRKKLSAWLNKYGLPHLRKALVEQHIYADSGDVEVQIEQGPFLLRANPRGSHGYLYLVATMAAVS